jgi:hypothetical protein
MEDALLENPPPPPLSLTDDFLEYFNDTFSPHAPSILGNDNDDVILNSSSNSSETPTSPSTPLEANATQLPAQQPAEESLNLEAAFSSPVVEPQPQPPKEFVEVKPDPTANVFETINEAHSKKRTRKKRKLNDQTAHSVEAASKTSSKKTDPSNLLVLSREELVGLTSQEFEEYVRQLMAQRQLSPEEMKELKRQRRLIKNRESAQASRQRKKNYVETLEAQVTNLATENANLKERITSLSTENARLKEEVMFLNDLIKKTPGLSTMFNSSLQMLSAVDASPNGKQTQQLISTNAKAAGLVLLVLLFSFGLFFNPSQLQQQQPLPLPWDSNAQTTTQAVGRILKAGSRFKEASSSGGDAASLFDVLSTQNFNPERLQRAFLRHRQETLQEHNSSIASLSSSRTEESRQSSVQPAEEKKALSIVDDVRRNITQWRPNTTYLMCSDVRHVTPPESVPCDPKSPMFLAFLIPPDSPLSSTTNNTTSNSNSNTNSNLIEVTCQVIDINLLPYLTPSQQQQQQQS